MWIAHYNSYLEKHFHKGDCEGTWRSRSSEGPTSTSVWKFLKNTRRDGLIYEYYNNKKITGLMWELFQIPTMSNVRVLVAPVAQDTRVSPDD